MKYPFIRKDGQVHSKNEPAATKEIKLFKVFVDFESEYRNAGFPGDPDIIRGKGGDYIDVQVDDSVTCEQIVPILDRLGYKPSPSS
ncbi:MAG TPA: hypothetical protein VJA47_02845 [archaeon]|nr:hypothetical protein [archaeon]